MTQIGHVRPFTGTVRRRRAAAPEGLAAIDRMTRLAGVALWMAVLVACSVLVLVAA